MKANHADVLRLDTKASVLSRNATRRKPLVHAGIDEDAGDLWRIGTFEEAFTTMQPEFVGQKFELDVTSGHIATETVSGIADYEGVWHDGASHFYIDGAVMKTGRFPCLPTTKAWGSTGSSGRTREAFSDVDSLRADHRV